MKTDGLTSRGRVVGEGVSQPSGQRLVQFEVERPCPQAVKPVMVPTPFPVWVFWPPEIASERFYDACDSPQIWRVTDASRREVELKYDMPEWTSGTHVCEHMGRIIE